MILFFLIIFFAFIYPFVSKRASLFFIGILIVSILSAFIFLFDAEDAMLFTFYALGAFTVGSLFRHFRLRIKYKSEAEDLINQYRNKSDEYPPL